MGISVAQRRLLDAAVDAFAECGFGGTTTRDIATRAGRSPAAVYVHHQSKEDLLFAASLAGHADALDCLRRAYDASEDSVQRLRGMIFDFSWWHIDNAKLGRVAHYEFHALTAPHRKQIIALRRQFHRLMVETIEAGLGEGRFDVSDVDGTARALLSMCIDLVRWFDPGLSRAPRSVAELNAALALRIVGATGTSGSPAAGR